MGRDLSPEGMRHLGRAVTRASDGRSEHLPPMKGKGAFSTFGGGAENESNN